MSKFQKVRNLFPPLVLRLSIITSVSIIAILIFITNTAEKAHSDSDIDYRQESVFDNPDIDSFNVVASEDIQSPVIAISFEVDKVTPTPTPQIVAVDSSSDDVWIKLAHCESKQNWSIDTGNGYYGGLQFSLGAWASVGGQGKPSEASKEEQIERGKMLQKMRGWGPWGSCSRKLGLIQ